VKLILNPIIPSFPCLGGGWGGWLIYYSFFFWGLNFVCTSYGWNLGVILKMFWVCWFTKIDRESKSILWSFFLSMFILSNDYDRAVYFMLLFLFRIESLILLFSLAGRSLISVAFKFANEGTVNFLSLSLLTFNSLICVLLFTFSIGSESMWNFFSLILMFALLSWNLAIFTWIFGFDCCLYLRRFYLLRFFLRPC